MEKKKSVWVIGHKNPDTDSICAAIAYADLKTRLGTPGMKLSVPGRSMKKVNMCWSIWDSITSLCGGCRGTGKRH